MVSHRAPSRVLFIIALALAVGIAIRAISTERLEFGDGREYILQTQAILFDRSLSIDPSARAEYWNRTNPYGVSLRSACNRGEIDRPLPWSIRPCAPGFGGLYQAKDGLFRFVHPWMYSLVAAPVYAVMHVIVPGEGEYLAFRVLNIILLFVPLGMLLLLRPSWWSLLFLACMLASPITPHLQWAHSEIFCLSAILTAFATLKYERLRWLGPISLGLGAAQNVPIVLLFPVHLWLLARENTGPHRLSVSTVAGLYLAGISLPLSMMAYYFSHYGVLNLMSAIGAADTSLITFNRIRAVAFSPMIGVFWYFPAAWLAVAIAWRKPERVSVVLVCASVAAVAVLSSATTNINSAQIGSPRYAVWFLAPLYFLPFLAKRSFDHHEDRQHRRLIIIASLFAVCTLLWLRTFYLFFGTWHPFHSLNRTGTNVASLYRATHFDDDIEPLVENIQRKELQVPHSFNGIYIWKLSESESVWVISKRAWMKARRILIKGDTTALERSEPLQRIFVLRTTPTGELQATPRSDVEFQTHPYWGDYLVVWVDGAVTSTASAARVFMRAK